MVDKVSVCLVCAVLGEELPAGSLWSSTKISRNNLYAGFLLSVMYLILKNVAPSFQISTSVCLGLLLENFEVASDCLPNI